MSKITAPLPISLNGDAVAGAVLFANRFDALSCWPRNGCVAEVGVAAGAFSQQIIDQTNPRRFDAYDLFQLDKEKSLWGHSPEEFFGGKSHEKFYRDRFSRQISENLLHIYRGDSSIELSRRPHGFYDVIYIDGDHRYEGVQKDTSSAIPALSYNGILVFNDYIVYDKNSNMYGVVSVVNDLCIKHGWRVKYFALQREMFCDIGLVRRSF